MTRTTVLGRDLRLGDTILVAGHARTIVEMEPYQHPTSPIPVAAKSVRWPVDGGHLDTLTVWDTDTIELAARPVDREASVSAAFGVPGVPAAHLDGAEASR